MKITNKNDIMTILNSRLSHYAERRLVVFGNTKDGIGGGDVFTSFYSDYATLQKHLLEIVDIDYMDIAYKECLIVYRIGSVRYEAKIGVIRDDGMFSQTDDSLIII